MNEFKVVIYPRSAGYFKSRIRSRVPGMNKGASIFAMIGYASEEIPESDFQELQSSIAFVADKVIDIESNVDVQTFDRSAYEHFQECFENPSLLGAMLSGHEPKDPSAVLATPEGRQSYDEIKRWLFPNVGTDWTVLAPHPSWGSAYLRTVRELTPDVVLIALAAAGVRLRVPSVNTIEKEIRDALKDKLESERKAYLEYVHKHVAECRKRLLDGAYADVAEFALWEFAPALEKMSQEIETATQKQDRKLVRHLVRNSIIGVPVIAAAAIAGQSAAIIGAALTMLCTSIADHWQQAGDVASPANGITYLLKLDEAVAADRTNE
jgi:hypothetical protein